MPNRPNLLWCANLSGDGDLPEHANLSGLPNLSGNGNLRWHFYLCGWADVRKRPNLLRRAHVPADLDVLVRLHRLVRPERRWKHQPGGRGVGCQLCLQVGRHPVSHPELPDVGSGSE